MTDKSLFKKIADTYATPAFVFDTDELTRRTGAVYDMLSSVGAKTVYSIKANPYLIPYLEDIADAFEVCSPGELSICSHYKVPASKIIYSGVNKGYDDVKAAVCYEGGVRPVYIVTAESIRHFELICDAAGSCDANVNVILRFSAKNQFGMSEEDIRHIILRSKNTPNVSIEGIHYFAGTGRPKLSHRQKELEMLKAMIIKLREELDVGLPLLQYGPGLPFPYFEGDDFSDTLFPLKELLPALSDIGKVCRVNVEMGRFIASSCGYYLTTVADVKQSFSNNWCILDGGINHVNYLGAVMGLKTPVIEVVKESDTSADSRHWTLCGSLCTTNDILARDFEYGDLAVGDLLVFKNIGAYSVTEGLNLFLSRNMPKILTVKGNDITLVRDTVQTWKLNI